MNSTNLQAEVGTQRKGAVGLQDGLGVRVNKRGRGSSNTASVDELQVVTASADR